MKRFIIIVMTAVLLAGMAACAFVAAPPKILLDGVEITSLSMFAGQELLLASDRTSGVTWSSSNDAVVVVEKDGYVRARGEGAADVTATVMGLSCSISVTVSPYVPVEEVKVVSEITIKAGGTKNLKLDVLPENASDPSLTCAVFPSDGMLTISNGVLTASPDAVSGAEYEVVITNDRSAVSAAVKVTISHIRGLTAWTIGDSIFDFNDNSETAMVQTMLRESGYVNFHMDNIAGATVRAASGVGVIDHIASGMYDSWEAPDLILLYRGTNDMYFGVQQPHFFTPESIEQAVIDTCIYFSEAYPDARIVWATPIWRSDVKAEKMDEMRTLLHTYCPQYGIEVFDLHLAESFAALSHENFGTVLYDGIHPTALGAQYLKDAFKQYLAK